jgi:hypothetical protein
MTSSADIVQAESLLVAGLAVVYGLWYPSLAAARDRKLPTKSEDAAKPKAEIRTVYRTRGVPLAICAAVTTVVFLAPSAEVLVDTAKLIGKKGTGALGEYDAVSASIVLITVASAFLTVHVGRFARRVGKRAE